MDAYLFWLAWPIFKSAYCRRTQMLSHVIHVEELPREKSYSNPVSCHMFKSQNHCRIGRFYLCKTTSSWLESYNWVIYVLRLGLQTVAILLRGCYCYLEDGQGLCKSITRLKQNLPLQCKICLMIYPSEKILGDMP